MMALQTCLARAKAKATEADPYDYDDAMESCSLEAAKDVVLRGSTHKLVACLRSDTVGSSRDCVAPCFYGG
jgi:hypothetical protein